MKISSSSIDVLYEDKDLFIINKPSGVHSSQGKNTKAIASELLKNFPELRLVAKKEADAGLVNRLDFETSGILIGAKSKKVWEALQRLLLSGQMEKTYLAVLEGNLKKTCIISNFLGSPYRRGKKVSAYNKPSKRALPAISEFFPLRFDKKNQVSFVKVRAHTARRHQIRVHAKCLGLPLLGDRLYGAKRLTSEVFDSAPSFILHADEVKFTHPMSGILLSCRAPRPQAISSSGGTSSKISVTARTAV